MQSTTRTSFVLPVPLLHRLHQTAQATNTSLSDLVRRLLEKGVAAQEQSTLTKTYAALERVKGISDANIQDASMTINETLYGENGAWKGADE